MTTFVAAPRDSTVMRAVGELVRTRAEPSRTEIVMPVLYPNGSHVVVFVYAEGDRFTVTDEGGGAHEAEMAGVTPASYAKIARREAARVGATCDNRAFFFLRVSAEQRAPAITVLADLARATVAAALEKLVTKAREAFEASLMEHLEHSFGRHNVEAHAEVSGASNTRHEVAALVMREGRPVVFDLFTEHAGSFNATVSKLYDISIRDDAPGRVAVTPHLARLGDRLNLINSVASVIELDAGDETYLRAAA